MDVDLDDDGDGGAGGDLDAFGDDGDSDSDDDEEGAFRYSDLEDDGEDAEGSARLLFIPHPPYPTPTHPTPPRHTRHPPYPTPTHTPALAPSFQALLLLVLIVQTVLTKSSWTLKPLPAKVLARTRARARTAMGLGVTTTSLLTLTRLRICWRKPQPRFIFCCLGMWTCNRSYFFSFLLFLSHSSITTLILFRLRCPSQAGHWRGAAACLGGECHKATSSI
jgi:hypothetical protein